MEQSQSELTTPAWNSIRPGGRKRGRMQQGCKGHEERKSIRATRGILKGLQMGSDRKERSELPLQHVRGRFVFYVFTYLQIPICKNITGYTVYWIWMKSSKTAAARHRIVKTQILIVCKCLLTQEWNNRETTITMKLLNSSEFYVEVENVNR